MKTLAIAVLIAMTLLVFGMDYEDQLAEERMYAEMVCGGYWPDYKGVKPDCDEFDHERN